MKPLLVVMTLVATAVGAASALVLEDDDFLERFQTRGGPTAAQVGEFLDALERSEPMICQDVSDAFGNFWWGHRDAGIGELGDMPAGLRARRDMLRERITAPDALELLGTRLNTPSACVRRVAARMLGRSWPASRMVVLDALAAQEPRRREAALLALGEAEDGSTRDLLERGIGDADPTVAAMAAWAVGQLEDAKSLPVLRRAVGHRDGRVQRAAIWALGEIEDRRARPSRAPGRLPRANGGSTPSRPTAPDPGTGSRSPPPDGSASSRSPSSPGSRRACG